VPAFARFGRSTSGTAPTPAPQTPTQSSSAHDRAGKLAGIVESPATLSSPEPFPALEKQTTRDSAVEAGDDLSALETLAELRRLKPPKKRFLDVQSA
ncbi:hypothetical protein LTR53_020095, partial [Teratosphaeriaceae sp. CCFEE 6253]